MDDQCIVDDLDCDGVLNVDDEDADGDGTVASEDCNDFDGTSTIVLSDLDCDGVFNVDDEDATEIETFLENEAKNGTSFDWSPPDTTTTFKWICRSFNREIFEFDRNRITASFEEVFEP